WLCSAERDVVAELGHRSSTARSGLDHPIKLGRAKWFFECGPPAQPIRDQRSHRGNEYNGNSAGRGIDREFLCDGKSVDSWQIDVEQHQVRSKTACELEPALRIARGGGNVAAALEKKRYDLGVLGLIIDDENQRTDGHRFLGEQALCLLSLRDLPVRAA